MIWHLFLKPSIPLTSDFIARWIEEIASAISEKQSDSSFDEVEIDLIVINKDQTLDNVIQDEEHHIRERRMIAKSENCADLDRHLWAEDLRLLTLKVHCLQLVFLEIFNKVELIVSNRFRVVLLKKINWRLIFSILR
jgi:hypothetical protein